jgi:hypothetical protein
MHFFYRAFLAGLLAGTVLGCGDNASKGMKNFQPGTGPNIQKEMRLKKGTKPMPPEPPGPKAPP